MLNSIAPTPKALSGLAPVYQGASGSFANLEVPLTDVGKPTGKKTKAELKRKSQFVLRANPKHAPFIAQAGIQVVSLANNHDMDFGAAGLKCELAALDKVKVLHAGSGLVSKAAYAPTVLTLKNGKKVALISALAFMGREAIRKTSPAGPNRPGIAVLPFDGKVDGAAIQKLTSWIATAKAQSDVVVLALHWGIERQTVPTSYQVNLARAAINCGADVVWGHHPHVLQGAEIYKGKPILYSMGNLISPLPSDTGLVRVLFGDDKKVKLAFVGARISGGTTKVLGSTFQPAAQRHFLSLCKQIHTKYPNKMSRMP